MDASGTLRTHPPTSLWQGPFRHSLASVALLEDGIARLRSGGREQAGVAATQRLIEAMATTCRAHGIRFSVVFLKLGAFFKAAYLPFLKQHGIDVIDCDLPAGPDMSVRGEGHPNGLMHGRWGDCVAAALAAETSAAPGAGTTASRGGDDGVR